LELNLMLIPGKKWKPEPEKWPFIMFQKCLSKQTDIKQKAPGKFQLLD
jgi:hypothetical protein